MTRIFALAAAISALVIGLASVALSQSSSNTTCELSKPGWAQCVFDQAQSRGD
jgi:hypothetical protein